MEETKIQQLKDTFKELTIVRCKKNNKHINILKNNRQIITIYKSKTHIYHINNKLFMSKNFNDIIQKIPELIDIAEKNAIKKEQVKERLDYQEKMIIQDWKNVKKKIEEQFDECKKEIAKFFVDIVDNKKKNKMTYDLDPSYDRSGHVFSTNISYKLRDYKLVNDFLESEYTGNWNASYESGCGKYWDTYSKDFDEFIREFINDIIEEAFQKLGYINDNGEKVKLFDIFDQFDNIIGNDEIEIEGDFYKKISESDAKEFYELGNGIQALLEKNIENLLLIIKKIREQFGDNNIYLTCMSFSNIKILSERVSTFGSDNISESEEWAEEFDDFMKKNIIEAVSIVLRVFKKETSHYIINKKGKTVSISVKDLYHFIITKDKIAGFSKEDTKISQYTDFKTGEKLKEENGLNIKSSLNLLKLWKL